jgi:hypothetical protein
VADETGTAALIFEIEVVNVDWLVWHNAKWVGPAASHLALFS